MDIFEKLLEDFIFTPVKGKRPYKQKWQEILVSREEIKGDLEKGIATGFALCLKGRGYLVIDVDGDSANEFLCLYLIENSLELPRTLQWTSKKSPNRYSFLLKLTIEQEKRIKSVVKTYKQIQTDKGEQIEFRWDKCCCVLPPSIHPDTGKPYEWIEETEIAVCEDALFEMFISMLSKNTKEKLSKINKSISISSSFEKNNIEEILRFIPIEENNDYKSWIRVLMALKSATNGSEEGLILADNWSKGVYSNE